MTTNLIFTSSRTGTRLEPGPAFKSIRENRQCQSPRCTNSLAADARPQRKYCSAACGRVAAYWRQTEEERKAENKRSNNRRWERDLLPRLRGLCSIPSGLTSGSPVARYAVAMVILQGLFDWRISHVLNYNQVRGKLAFLAGGFDELTEIEDEVHRKSIEARESLGAVA